MLGTGFLARGHQCIRPIFGPWGGRRGLLIRVLLELLEASLWVPSKLVINATYSNTMHSLYILKDLGYRSLTISVPSAESATFSGTLDYISSC